MYSSRDWELFGSMSAESILIYFVDPKNNRSVNKFFIRYKTEEIVQSESIQDFCLKNKVFCNLFHKWHKDTRYHIILV